jgi:hypothetical protein
MTTDKQFAQAFADGFLAFAQSPAARALVKGIVDSAILFEQTVCKAFEDNERDLAQARQQRSIL